MSDTSESRDAWIIRRFERFSNQSLRGRPVVFDDNEAGLCHGDIRNDHIFIDNETGRFRWIDFDLTQTFPDFDVWSVGNILHYIVGKGFIKFRDVVTEQPDLNGRLTDDDASAFFPYRIMNLRKVYSYLPERLNRVLLNFSVGASANYDRVDQVLDDLGECASAMGRPTVVPAVDSDSSDEE